MNDELCTAEQRQAIVDAAVNRITRLQYILLHLRLHTVDPRLSDEAADAIEWLLGDKK